ncbi:capsular polysaccharide biosynthesis protein [Halomonas nitroreducens]|uniref:Capsular polysaccharide biosynthesis protein n=1 Tax=Halomonas nitroreducens TaxID=447425 RepID=A0A431V5V3_9GAMM|nr:capsular polysaccharide biosynthesis protein [Halomonas nitroreducens]RTR05124.1 capsular polysaccharide biosynthesis protein [Halomonas nitroreducens]
MTPQFGSAAVATRRMLSLPTLRACLPDVERFQLFRPRLSPRRPQAIIGWGHKPSSRLARRHAARHGVPYVAVEDGFLRSWGLGVHGFAPHSLVVDHQGIYYDASRPSDLERLIEAADFAPEEIQRARRAMHRLRTLRLSKYNHAPDRPLPPGERPRILVVDQTAGDASIAGGLAGADDFATMLERALAEHPDAEVLVKVHPDVVAGKKRGHLDRARAHPRCRIVGEDLNPWALLDAVACVHVVTSQLGFEALIAGKRVVCHGVPFYAGWGLTDDRRDCPRRGQPRTLEQVFAAAYLRYARYANPYTGEATTLEATIDLIGDQLRHQRRLQGRWTTYGLSRWKRGFVGDFLGAEASVRHADSPGPGPVRDDERSLCWASRDDRDLRDAGRHAWRMEDGFIRSVGLGVDLARPLSLVVDARGIYYDARRPSDLEHLLNHTPFDDDLRQRAAALRQRLVRLRLSKYNVAGGQVPTLPTDRRIVLVPGQVESDASVAHGSPDIRSNRALLSAVRADNPDACIVYKPHPDVLSGARIGQLDEASAGLYDVDASHADITGLLDRVDEVHTMSSLTGFEALLRGRRVVTYGMPFYAGWGLTEDHRACHRRQRRLALEELIAGVLILYPLYVDPATRQLCNAETAVSLLEHYRRGGGQLTWKHRVYRWYRNTFIGRH